MRQFVFLWLLAMSIYGQNVMSVPDYSGRSNDTLEIELKISNSNSFVAFQTDVALPSQVSYIPNSAALTGRSNGHMISATLLQNNILRILAFSVNQSTFLSDTGSVAKFKVKLKTEPGSYSLQLINPIISNANSSNILTSSENGSITIVSPKLIFYPADVDFGRIPLWSSSDQYVYIQNQGSSDLVISRLSTENQYFRVVGDTSFTIEPWGNRAITIRFNSLKKGLYSSKLNIRSNDPSSSVASVQLTAIAFAVNELHGLPAYGRSGYPVDLHFSINNMEPITGFQFDIVTPNALSFIQDSIFLTGRRGDHIVTANYISPNRLRVIAFSPTNQTFTDSLGNIVRIKFDLNGTGGDHYYTLENVIISDVSASNVMSAYYSSYVNIASPDIQGNSNINFGDVSVKDTAIFGYQIFNNGNDTLKISSITSNDPSFRIDFTAPLTLPQYTSATLNTFFHNTVKGSYSGRLTIRSNDPDADPFYVNLSAVAYTPNYIIMNDARGLTNDTVVTGVNIDNYEQFVAFQVDVLIPDGLVYLPNSAQLTSRKVDHMLSVAGIGADKIRIVAFSPTQQHFKGNSGEVVKLKFRTGSNAGGYPVILSNGILSNSTSQNVIRGTRDGTLTTYNRPSKPTLIAPTNNSVNISRNPLLTWTEQINSDYYSLQFSRDSLFINTLFTIDSIFATQYQVNNLDFNTKYFWRVRGNNSVINGPWSDVGNFTTIVEKPSIPLLALPVNNTKGLLNPVTAKWNKSLRVEKYKLQVSTDSLFGSLIVNDSTLTDTTKVLPNLDNYSQYYWRVKAVNVGGESDWSTVWNFKTLGNPYATNLLTPLDAAINQSIAGLTFKWTKAKERIETIQKYQLQISTDSLFITTFVNDSTLTDTMKVVGGMGYLTKYFWRVRVHNQTGWGDWSNTWRFTTIIEKPTIPLLALPLNNTKGLLNPFTTKWNKSLRVEKYRLQVSTDSLFGSFIVNDSTLTDTTKQLPTLVNYSQYYWRVKAVNVGGESDWSGVWNFKTLGNPYASNIVSPLDASVNQPLNELTFKWTKANERIETIQKYQLQISTDSLFASTFVNDSTLTDTSKVVSGMGYLTKYFWRVRAQNQTGWGDWSNTWRFTTIIEKPTIPVLVLPVNGSKGLLNPITVKWNKSLRVEKYKLQVSTDSLFGSFVVNDTALADTTKLHSNLANYSQYYWRVKAVNVGGESDWSTVWNFKTLGNPYASNLITPLDASVNQPLNGLTFKWTRANERIETIQEYQFQISTDSLFTSTFVNDSTLTDTMKVVGGMGYLTKYYWRVRAQNQTGWGEWSNIWRFTTIVEKPTIPLLALPLNNTKGLLNPITAKWNKSLRVEKYKLQVSTDSLFGTFVFNDSTLTDTTKPLPNLANYSQYYWRVKAVNIGGESDWSTVWNFKTLGNPYSVVLASPANGAVNNPVNNATFRWFKPQERTETILKYHFQLSTDSLFGSVVFSDSTFIMDTTTTGSGLSYLTTYFWRVRAKNETGWGDWSQVWSLTTVIEKPSAPLLASPANNATQQLQPVILKWKQSLRVDKYTLEVSEISSFATLFLVDSTLTDTMRTLPQLQTPKTYYWRVKASNIGGYSEYSTVWNFRTLGFPLAVNLIAPANGSVNLPINSVLLKWSTAGEQTLGSVTSGGKVTKKGRNDEEQGIDEEGRNTPKNGNLFASGSANPTSGIESIGKYWLEIKTDTNSATLFFSDSTLTDTTKLMSGFGYLKTYFWRVKANNEVGWGSFSGWSKFTTIIERPTQPVLASPANNSLGMIQPVTVKWIRSERAERYTLEVSANALFTTVVFKDTTITDTAKTIPTLSPVTSYYWRVSARNTGGVSDTSSVWNFKTLGTPTVVTLVTPANNAVNVPINNVVFNWTKANDRLETIQRYRFELKTDTTSGTFVVVDTLLIDTTKMVASLQNLTGYYWRISAKNEAGWGEFTGWNRFTTVKKPIATPTALTAIATAVKKVTLSWTDNSDNELGFIILRKSGDSTSTATLVRIDSVGANITEYIDSTVTDTTYYSYKVMAYNTDTLSNQSNFATVFTLTGIREFAGDIPKEFTLYQNYPNPFNPSTIIRFAIPKDAHVEIELYSIHGELVQKLVSEDKHAGYYEISLELPAYASGIYFYRIVATHEGNAEPFVQTRKLILMK